MSSHLPPEQVFVGSNRTIKSIFSEMMRQENASEKHPQSPKTDPNLEKNVSLVKVSKHFF
jgi:hypothetical protein